MNAAARCGRPLPPLPHRSLDWYILLIDKEVIHHVLQRFRLDADDGRPAGQA